MDYVLEPDEYPIQDKKPFEPLRKINTGTAINDHKYIPTLNKGVISPAVRIADTLDQVVSFLEHELASTEDDLLKDRIEILLQKEGLWKEK